MIKTYKLYTGKYDQQVALALPKNVTGEYFTRGNCNKLLVKRCRYEPRKNFFSNRIVNIWNSLPDYVVMYDTINTFKNRHWKHWKDRFFISLSSNLHQRLEFMFEYKKINELLRIGNANPGVIFQTRVYGFDIWWVTCQWQTRKSV